MSIIIAMARVTPERYRRLLSGDELWEPPAESVDLHKMRAVLLNRTGVAPDFRVGLPAVGLAV